MSSSSRSLTRRSLAGLAALPVLWAGPRAALGQTQGPEPVRVPLELAMQAEALDCAVVLGNPKGDVTMVEFFDYNCSFCKVSGRELDRVLKADPDLKYVLINLAVLGLPSVLAHKVALGYLTLHGPQRYAALHRRFMALSGTLDGDRALAEAAALGANRAKLTDAANEDRIGAMLKQSVDLADNLGLAATPSFLVGAEAYIGYIPALRKLAIAKAERA